MILCCTYTRAAALQLHTSAESLIAKESIPVWMSAQPMIAKVQCQSDAVVVVRLSGQ